MYTSPLQSVVSCDSTALSGDQGGPYLALKGQEAPQLSLGQEGP